MNPSELIARWRSEAELYRRRGLEEQARMAESYAAELATCLCEHELEALTLEQAVAESGYTYSALEKMIRDDRLVNAGRTGAPRVRRGDLPRKARAPELEGPGLAERMRAV